MKFTEFEQYDKELRAQIVEIIGYYPMFEWAVTENGDKLTYVSKNVESEMALLKQQTSLNVTRGGNKIFVQ